MWTIMLRVCLRFCVFLLTLSFPFHQNAHVNKLSVYEKVYSSRCLFYFQSYTVNIFKYKGKYLLRRIPHASHGSFNPFVISNKQAHVINGNIPVRTKETDNVTGIIQQPATGTNDRRQHFYSHNSFQGYPIYPKHPTESPSGLLLYLYCVSNGLRNGFYSR